MTVQNDYNISLDILQHLGEVVAEVSGEGLINDVRIKNKHKYPGEEERYRGSKLSDLHPIKVADQFVHLINRSLHTGETGYLEFLTSYRQSPAVYSVRVLPYHPDKRFVYFVIDDITNKDRIELLENKWKLALDAAGDGMWDLDIEANTIYFSDKWYEIFGYTRDEVDTDASWWSEKIYPDDLHIVAEAFEDYLSGKTTVYTTEIRCRCKDGSYKWILSRGVLISKTADGKPLRMIGTHTDITQRKIDDEDRLEFETKLENQKNFYEQILNWLPGDIAVFDKGGRFVYLNQRSVKDPELRAWLIGKTDEDYCRRRNKPLTIAETRKPFYEKVMKDGAQHEWEEKFVTSEGKEGYKLRRLSPIFDDSGQTNMMVGYGVDITEQVQTAEALRTSNEIFRNAFDSSGIGMALVSPYGKWLNVNNSVCQITGYSKEELLQRTFQDITHPDDLAMDMELIKKLLSRDTESYNLEKRYISKSNKIVWVLLSVSVVWNSDGSPKFFIAQIIDITKKKELADEINRKNRELEAAQASLINRIQQLEELNHIIAHNLRGPARNVRMLSSVLKAKQADMAAIEDEEIAGMRDAFTTEEAVSLIDEGAHALTDSLDTLMEVAKISLNKDIQSDNCDLEQVIQAILGQLNGAIFEKQASVRLHLAVRHIQYPKVYLESILYNFISNALKYARIDVAPDIIVSSQQVSGRIMLSIKDNGMGIDLDRYHDKLFKLNQVFHKGFDSKGVGLFLTKSQVEALGGSIEVKSKVDEGTEFIVTL